jgi:GNAT superfamily N-acetyltransferase
MPASVRRSAPARLPHRRTESASWTGAKSLAPATAGAHAGGMGTDGERIERVDVADDEAMLTSYAILHAAYTAEHPDDPLPTAPEVIAMARATEKSQQMEFWLMHDGEAAVGTYRLDLPMLDNLDFVELALCIDPPHQHRGHGRVLLAHATDRIAQLGRHQVALGVNEPADGPPNRAMRFAAATGASRSLGEVRRSLDLTALDTDRLATLRAEAEKASVGYELVSWTNPCPDDLVDDFAALYARMSTDAPLGDLDIEPEHWDSDRVREREATIQDQGRRQMVTAARVGPDGPLVAFTDIAATRHDPVNAFQWSTLVVKEHRGHRLGALVKLANLERLVTEAPQARRLHTWNADVNSYMISINEAMGFVVAQRESVWRLDLPRDPEEAP